jgi:hypothetical protein
MAEILVEFEGTVTGIDERAYEARAIGRARADGLWEGWLEFAPLDGSTVLRTGRETTQPSREDAVYWATGLTINYLDGALLRILRPTPVVRPRATTARPAYNEPAERGTPSTEPVRAIPRAVLDPFAVYAEGERILRQQLNALSEGQLRIILKAYGLTSADPAELDDITKPTLIGLIMMAVSRRAA